MISTHSTTVSGPDTPAPPRAGGGRPHATLDAAISQPTQVAILCWITATYWLKAAVRRASQAPDNDRGEALTTAVITVGLVLIAALVLAILKDKSETIANQVCTNADPSTCT